MSRLMSVALTEDAVRERRKTVSRRLGWKFLKPGDTLTLCRKARGVPKAERVDLAEVEVVSVRQEPLYRITRSDVEREGFPGWAPERFMAFFAYHMKCGFFDEVTRIEWRYLDEAGDSL